MEIHAIYIKSQINCGKRRKPLAYVVIEHDNTRAGISGGIFANLVLK
jgi:hypothetical protein